MGEFDDLLDSDRPPVSDALGRLIEQHRPQFERAQDELDRLAGAFERFRLDDERGIIEFSDAEQVRLRARAQMIATYSPRTRVWQWGWANTAVSPNLIALSVRLRESEAAATVPELQRSSFECSEAEASGIAAVAQALLHAHSIYRVPADGDLWGFLALFDPGEPPGGGFSDAAWTEETPPASPSRRSPKRPSGKQASAAAKKKPPARRPTAKAKGAAKVKSAAKVKKPAKTKAAAKTKGAAKAKKPKAKKPKAKPPKKRPARR